MKAWKASESKNRVAVISGVRTPFAKAGTKLKDTSAVHLGVSVAVETLARANLPASAVDEVVFGNAGTPADAANISRVIALRAGIPQSTPAYTVHRNCASAMEAIAQGCMKISLGMGDVVLAGGTESMSQMPLMFGDDMKNLFATLMQAKTPQAKLMALSTFRPQYLKPKVAIMEGLTDPVSGLNMGQTAEILARDFGISRSAQDEYAVESHRRTVEATKAGKFDEEIMPVEIAPQFKEFLDSDIGPRDGQSMEALAKLKPFFDRENGTITPGNSCPITDGACTVMLMNEARAKAEGHEILGTIEAFTFTGCEPKRMGMGPIYSTAQLLDDTNTPWSEIQLMELNEAFAAQVIANQIAFNSKKYCQEKLGRSEAIGELPASILNVNGGAIALGHPVGTTGARLVLTALLEMKRKNLHKSIATLCIGGGQGGAFLLQRN